MKNLIKAIETEQKNRLESFILEINKVADLKGLNTWQYNDLLPKGKKVDNLSFDALKAYLIDRKQKAIYKAIEREVKHIQTVFNAPDLESITISMEWKKSRMWGSNPNAEARVIAGNYSDYFESGSIGGCGYDKGSTAVANAINQSNSFLKAMYLLKDANINTKNHELFGYGSGYGILPRLEGGVGVSCYPAIFEKLGFTFKTTASGKTFDVYTVTKQLINS